MEGKITAPWGDLDYTQSCREQIGYFINQLIYMLQTKQSQNRARIEIDIKGYRLLQEQASDETIYKFLQIKRNARDAGKKFSDNVAVVNHMKTHGLWQGK